MPTTLKEDRMTQLVLFGERVAVPDWCDMAEPTRMEAVRLLTRLLISVSKHNLNASHAIDRRGERDE
jgi:hypothetical protein